MSDTPAAPSAPSCPAAPSLPPVVDASEVPDGAHLVDIRWALDGSKGRGTYRAGHLTGAVYVDLGADLAAPASATGGRHPLPTPEDFAAAMGRAGISDGDTVITYDDTDGSQASRLVWMLRALGEEAALLDGGLRAAVAAGARLETDDVRPDPGSFTPRPWGADVVATPDEAARAASGEADAPVVVDARAPERYRGETEPIDPRAGHVPGAVNVPFTGNVDGAGRFLPADALRARFAAAGVPVGDSGADVIVYCGSGVTATHDLLALERAGGRARLLPGSWSQWSADPSRPVATGD